MTAALAVAGVSLLLLDANTGRLIESQWPEAERPVPVGSLVKPFAALAYGMSHGFRFPEVVCKDNCWLPRGHGRVGLETALAHSCNNYFRRLAEDLAPEGLSSLAVRFGLSGPPPGASPIGEGDGWSVAPLALARAYAELAARGGEPGVKEVLAGLARCASEGTGGAIGAGSLAKTGTAPCTHARKSPGDGYVVVLYPAAHPRRVLLLRVEGAPGSRAAAVAGKLLGKLP